MGGGAGSPGPTADSRCDWTRTRRAPPIVYSQLRPQTQLEKKGEPDRNREEMITAIQEEITTAPLQDVQDVQADSLDGCRK